MASKVSMWLWGAFVLTERREVSDAPLSAECRFGASLSVARLCVFHFSTPQSGLNKGSAAVQGDC